MSYSCIIQKQVLGKFDDLKLSKITVAKPYSFMGAGAEPP